jgi:hypothetical protein
VDLDATIVIAHSEKEQASETWKKTYGFHPMTAWADHGASGNGEPLAIVQRQHVRSGVDLSTQPMLQYIKSGDPGVLSAREHLYVAVTRARHSVAFVVSRRGATYIP